MKHGIVTEISGPVVDVRFAEGELPSINEALTLTAEGPPIPWRSSSTFPATPSAAL